MFSGHGLEFGSADVGPGQELVDLAVGMAVDDPGEHVGEIAERLDAVELAGLDQRGDDGPMLGAAVGAGEERVLAVERDRADGAFDHVAVDLDAAVVEEAGQAFPARERVADRLGELGLLADQSELLAQPGFEAGDDRAAPFLAHGAAFVGRSAADVVLDPVELGDPFAASRWRSARDRPRPVRRRAGERAPSRRRASRRASRRARDSRHNRRPAGCR